MGRHRVAHACCLEDTVWLDIRLFKAWGFLKPGSVVRGVVDWRTRGANLQSAQVVSDLRTIGKLRATIIWHDADGAQEAQTVGVERARCRFGGWRYYFVCPRTGRRCEVMPLLDGEFASRQAHAIAYASQSEGELDRAYRRRDNLQRRIDGANGVRKPTGAKHRRLTEQLRLAAQKARRLRSDALRRRFGMA